MGLSASLNIAQSALASASAQSSVISRNIGNVNTPGYSRKTAGVITTQNGSSTVASIQRATDTALLANVLQAQSDSAAQSALSAGLTTIQQSLGLNATSSTSSSSATAAATDQSPSTLLSNFNDALQAYASAPDNTALGTAAVVAANALTSTLNAATSTVQGVRAQADSQIATSVQTINNLLTQFQSVNQQIVKGTALGTDISDAQDTRDSILSQLSSQLGITATATSNGGMSLATDSGVVLFDQTARTLSFKPTTTYTAATTGHAVTVDGVAITGSSMGVKSGALAGLTQLRDVTATTYQGQLDQIAGSLVSTFAETSNASPSTQVAGLFVNGTSSVVPTATTGLAGSIAVNANVDPAKNGTVTLLRDGDISQQSTNSNAGGDAAYAGRLSQLVSALADAQVSGTVGVAGGSLTTYAASSVSWVSSNYQTASNAASYQSSLVNSATSALSNSTGVNLDDQMSQMLEVEHAYQASAQLLNSVNSMYSSLITALN